MSELTSHTAAGDSMPTFVLLLGVLVLMSVLIAGYFYLAWAKARDTKHTSSPAGPR